MPGATNFWRSQHSRLTESRVKQSVESSMAFLQQCRKRKALAEGRQAHAHIIRSGSPIDSVLGNQLILFYSDCGKLVDAQHVFDELVMSRDIVSWNAMIKAYGHHGPHYNAIHLFFLMQKEGFQPDIITFVSTLHACSSSSALALGKIVHGHILEAGVESHVIVGNSLVNMYGKCGDIVNAVATFNRMQKRDVVSWNSLIAAYIYQDYGKEALELFQQMQAEGMKPNMVTFINILNVCSNPKALSQGKLLHAHIIVHGFELDVRVGTSLVTMYGKCGSEIDMLKIFDKMPERNVVTWNAIITAYARDGYNDAALNCFQQMQQHGTKPDRVAFISILSTCTCPVDLALGKLLHAYIVDSSLDLDPVIENILVNVYSKCGSICNAHKVFDNMRQRDLVSWNTIIAGYVMNGYDNEALKLFHEMQQNGLEPDRITLISILNLCTTTEALELGKLVHSYINKGVALVDTTLENALVSMYGKCGSIKEARSIFDQMTERNIVSWNVMIGAYAAQGNLEEAFKLYRQMQEEGKEPEKVTFLCLLNACTGPEAVTLGKLVHVDLLCAGLASDLVMGTALLNMYVKCGSMQDARRIFDNMPERNLISWTAIISGYCQDGNSQEGLKLFSQMQKEGIPPDIAAFVSAVSGCTRPELLTMGKLLHAQAIEEGTDQDIIIATALVHMYSECGRIEDAQRMFNKMPERNVVTWNVMIATYAQYGHLEEAFMIFNQMQREGLTPDTTSFINILNACIDAEAKALGKLLYAQIVDREADSNLVLQNALLNMYWKCSNIKHARWMFDEMPERDVISWNVMIAAYAQYGDREESFKLFQQMQEQSVTPDKLTFISLLNACATPQALDMGKRIHAHVIDIGFELHVGAALVHMYGKCGSIHDAQAVFEKFVVQDSVLWTAMITAYAQHGDGEKALEIFRRMLNRGIQPDQVTFISVLNACSHAGLVDEAFSSFNSMSQTYGITPTLEHYNCMIDLLGRAGHSIEAEDFIRKMPLEPDAVVWMTLLGSCRIHGHIDIGKSAAEHAVLLNTQAASPYVALSNMYAASDKWNHVNKVRK